MGFNRKEDAEWRKWLKPEEAAEIQRLEMVINVARADLARIRARANGRIHQPRKRERERKKREERAKLPPLEVYG